MKKVLSICLIISIIVTIGLYIFYCKYETTQYLLATIYCFGQTFFIVGITILLEDKTFGSLIPETQGLLLMILAILTSMKERLTDLMVKDKFILLLSGILLIIGYIKEIKYIKNNKGKSLYESLAYIIIGILVLLTFKFIII